MARVKRVIGGLAALTLGACAAGGLAGCGSGSKPVSVASTQEAQTSTTATTSSAPTTTTTTTTTQTSTGAPAPTSEGGGTSAPSTTTRTAPEPAFTESEHHEPALKEALNELQSRGYAANDESQYHANQTLRVLVGTKARSGEGHEQQAFFFVDGRYIGTDTKKPSATVEVLSQSDTEVTLGYPLYRSSDPLSSPSGGRATVTFALNDGKLAPLGAIPPAISSTGLSRR
jgi:hypothetical protein